jgi:hypothetical protein
MTIEWTSIIIDNVIGYLLDRSGLGEEIQRKLRYDPIKKLLIVHSIALIQNLKNCILTGLHPSSMLISQNGSKAHLSTISPPRRYTQP